MSRETKYQSGNTPWKMRVFQEIVFKFSFVMNSIIKRHGEQNILIIDAMAGTGKNKSGGSTTSNTADIISCNKNGIMNSLNTVFLSIERCSRTFDKLNKNLGKKYKHNVTFVWSDFINIIGKRKCLESTTMSIRSFFPDNTYGLLIVDHQGFPNKNQFKAIKKFSKMFPMVDIVIHLQLHTLSRNKGNHKTGGFDWYRKKFKKSTPKYVCRKLKNKLGKKYALYEVLNDHKNPKVVVMFTGFKYNGLNQVFKNEV